MCIQISNQVQCSDNRRQFNQILIEIGRYREPAPLRLWSMHLMLNLSDLLTLANGQRVPCGIITSASSLNLQIYCIQSIAFLLISRFPKQSSITPARFAIPVRRSDKRSRGNPFPTKMDHLPRTFQSPGWPFFSRFHYLARQ